MNYPGRIIKVGETDAAIVKHIRAGLTKRGYKPPANSVGYDSVLKSVIKLFQVQNVDVEGNPLKVDGEVGPMTWGALFGTKAVPAPTPTSIAAKALAIAIGELGVREVGFSNSGPRVDQYLAATGLNGGHKWCMAFVFWCFREASGQSGLDNPFPKMAHCLATWNKVKTTRPDKVITKAQAQANPNLVKPGAVFILDYGNNNGHTGFVKSNKGGALITVEGNTNPMGSNDGGGVHQLTSRSVMTKNLRGFINFT